MTVRADPFIGSNLRDIAVVHEQCRKVSRWLVTQGHGVALGTM
jgi:hypothetical protein